MFCTLYWCFPKTLNCNRADTVNFFFTFSIGYGIVLPLSRSGGMADALASGASGSNTVWVQVPSSACEKERALGNHLGLFSFFCDEELCRSPSSAKITIYSI